MSVKGYIDLQLNALDQAVRYPLQQAFYYLMDGWRLGSGVRAENAQWYRISSTTHATANTEFSFLHGLSSPPQWIIPVVDLTQINSQLVPLQVSRAADNQRVYLKSSSTSAVFTVYVE